MLHRNWNTLDAICDRLLRSRNPHERNAIYAGRKHPGGFPVFIDEKLLREHMHVIGPPGTGKTSLVLEGYIRQFIRRNNGPVVIIDCKGDMGLFNAVRAMSIQEGRTFKHFCTKAQRSTYVFNPWDPRLLRKLTLPQALGFFLQALNLYHGEDYARAYFTMQARTVFRRVLVETIPDIDKRPIISVDGKCQPFPPGCPIQSFKDLLPHLKRITDDDEFKHAQHLCYIIEALTDFDQLNLVPKRSPDDPAIQHAIFMPDVIREKQVVYFYLDGALDTASVAEIAKLALYCLLIAAIAYQDENGRPANIHCVWDEAQIMIAKNIENVLAQARSCGLGCILSHQSMSQLNQPGGSDMRELVWTCSATKHLCAVRDPWLINYIANTSGTTKYYEQSYNLSARELLAGAIDPRYALTDRNGKRAVGVKEYVGPRLTPQDILDISQDPHLHLMWLARREGLSAYQGWFPVRVDWPISSAEHKQLEQMPWPARDEKTTEMKLAWPEKEIGMITVKSEPADFDEQQAVVSKRLRRLRNEQ